MCLVETSYIVIIRPHGSAQKRGEYPPYLDLGEHHRIQRCFSNRWTGLSLVRLCGTSAKDLPRGHQNPTPWSSPDIVKQRNIAACHHPRAQLQECRTPTTGHKSHRLQRPVRWPGHLLPDATGWSSVEMEEKHRQIILTRRGLLHRSGASRNH
jgi:hypothetical protein